MKTNKKHTMLLYLLGMGSLLCFACMVHMGCGSSTSSENADADANNITSQQATVVLIPREPLELDPRFVADTYGLRLSRLIFASLVTIDPLRVEPIMDLAAHIDVLDAVTYRVTLRQHLRFSDGSALTSKDVRATYDGVRSEALKSRYRQSYARIVAIDTPDEQTVVFHLDGPHATFLTDLELPIVRQQDAFRHMPNHNHNHNYNYIGAGPYRMTQRVRGRIEMSANPHWWHGVPEHPRLRFWVVVDENTRALRLQAGEADIALNALSALLLPMFKDDPRYTIKNVPGIGTTYLGFHNEARPFSDLRVRHAIAHAIDRALLIETELDGNAHLTNTWIPADHWASVPNLPSITYDPARARQLLDEAGYRDPDGINGPEPRLQLQLRTSTDRARLSIARAIAGMLADVGIDVTVAPSETATLIADLNKGRFQMTLLQVPEVIEPHVLSWFLASDHIPEHRQEGANRWRFRNAAFDAALEKGRRHTDRAVRYQAYAEAQRIFAEALPVFSLWQEDAVAIIKKDIGYQVPRDGRFTTLAWTPSKE